MSEQGEVEDETGPKSRVEEALEEAEESREDLAKNNYSLLWTRTGPGHYELLTIKNGKILW